MAEHATRELTAAPIARYAGTRRIIRAAEFGVITDAATLLDAARAQAESILAQARQDAASLRVQEATRGYQDGLARARDEYAASIVAHHTDDAQRAAALEERVCLMVTRTLNKVLGAHEHDGQFFASVIPRVLRATRDEKYLTMRVATAPVGVLGKQR